MFVVELKTKAVKIKNFKCFVNSNYFEDKSKRNPCFNSCNIFCFNSYTEKKKKHIFSAQKSSYSHDHTKETILLFIIVTYSN